MVSSGTCKFCWWWEILIRDQYSRRWLMSLNNNNYGSKLFMVRCRDWRYGNFKSYSILVTLWLLTVIILSLCDESLFVTKPAVWCCTISSFWMSDWWCRSHMQAQYSKSGSSIFLYSCSLRQAGQVLGYLCKIPSAWFT